MTVLAAVPAKCNYPFSVGFSPPELQPVAFLVLFEEVNLKFVQIDWRRTSWHSAPPRLSRSLQDVTRIRMALQHPNFVRFGHPSLRLRLRPARALICEQATSCPSHFGSIAYSLLIRHPNLGRQSRKLRI